MTATPTLKRKRRTTHTLLVLVMLATLLFSRLALAFYVCPTSPQQAAVVMIPMSGTDCIEMSSQSGMMDEAQPALCAQHFSDEQQITSATAHAQVLESFVFLAYPLPRLSTLLASLPDWSPITALEDPPGPGGSGDALYLQTLRLRV